METVVISLTDLMELVSGRSIICGSTEVRVAQDDLDGLMVYQALYNVFPIFSRLLDLGKLDE